MLIPYSTALSLGRKPWITIATLVLCTFIYWQQDRNNDLIHTHAVAYCTNLHVQDDGVLEKNYVLRDTTNCSKWIENIHSRPNPESFFMRLLKRWDWLGSTQAQLAVDQLRDRYTDFLSTKPPRSLDAALMYDPYGLNPIRMVTSALAHADWMHLIGNMIFYMAFAPALEMLIGGWLRYIAIMLAIAVVSSIAYSFSIFFTGNGLPSLGFSGVVTGMIGLSAFMMPNAKIKTLLVFGFGIHKIFIPAWILALWYIGWDSWYVISSTDMGNVNLIAHVSGGISGYLIGYFFLKQQRELTKDDLNDAIEWQRSDQDDKFGILSSYRKSAKFYQNEERLHQAKKDYQDFVSRIFLAVRAGKNSEAIIMLLPTFRTHLLSHAYIS